MGIGLEHGYLSLAGILGLAEGSPMGEINGALAQINSRVDAIHAQLEEIADGAVWNAFDNAHTEAKGESSEIFESARDIAEFERFGIEPPAAAVNIVAEGTRDAMIDLGPTLITGAGTGAVPALTKLLTHMNPVSDSQEQWEQVLAYTERYRSAYAQGIMNLLWAAQFDEAHGSNWQVFAAARAEEADERVKLIYDYIGAPYPQRPGDEQKWVHANGADWAMAWMIREPYRGEEPQPLFEKATAHPKFVALANYRPQDGTTLQAYLADRGFTHTTITYADRYGYDRTCPWSCRYSVYNHQGRVVGNDYAEHKDVYWEFNSSLHRSDVYNRYIKPNIEQNQQFVRNNPRIASIDVPVNPQTGMPASMEKESIRAQRDGLEDLEISRGEGAAVDASFANSGGYDSLQIVAIGDDEPALALDLSDGHSRQVGTFEVPEGALELRVGYSVDGDLDLQDARATSVLAANPGADSITLHITAEGA